MTRRPDQVTRLTNGIVDLEVTTGCGPRITRFGWVDERNVFAHVPQLVTHTPLGPWYPIGGHRLWVAPERMPGSYAPDTAPVSVEASGLLRARFTAPADQAGMQKIVQCDLDPAEARVVVTHEIVNRTCWPVRVAPWAITIVDANGTALLPQPPFRSHAEDLLPARPLVQWSYTDFTDPRWRIGKRLIALTPDEARGDPQKVGVANHAGWCAVVYEDGAFIKEAAFEPCAEYPDFGCSAELFAAGAYLEIETLGPLRLLEPGARAVHLETWLLSRTVRPAGNEAALEAGIDAARHRSAAESGLR